MHLHEQWPTVDPRFLTNRDRTLHAEEIKKERESVVCKAPAAHWIEVLEEAGVLSCPIQTVAEAEEHSQVQARNMMVEASGLRVPGNPIKMSAFRRSANAPPAAEP